MMESLWFRTITNKGNPIYWPFLCLLWFVSLFYSIGLYINRIMTGSVIKLNTPVISVGNITVGGSGKTPIVSLLAEYFQSNGKKVAVLSSGYGRKSKEVIFGLGDKIKMMEVDQIGDEIKMMAEMVPGAYYCVSGDKLVSAMVLDKKGLFDLLIIDDGFHMNRLNKDINLLLLDASIDLAREWLFPAGRLREPIKRLNIATDIIITRVNIGQYADKLVSMLENDFTKSPIALLNFENSEIASNKERIPIDSIKEKPVYFFAGIGNFGSLLSYLSDKFTNLVGFRKFDDHCRYGQDDIRKVNNDIGRYNPELVLTTSKDYVKIHHFDFGRPLYYLRLEVVFKTGLNELLERVNSVVEG